MSSVSSTNQVPFNNTPHISLSGKGKSIEPIIDEINQVFAVHCITDLFKGKEVTFCFYDTYKVDVSDLSSPSRKYFAEMGTANVTVEAPLNCHMTLNRICAAFKREIPGKKFEVSPIMGHNIFFGSYGLDVPTLEGYKCVLIDLSLEHKKNKGS